MAEDEKYFVRRFPVRAPCDGGARFIVIDKYALRWINRRFIFINVWFLELFSIGAWVVHYSLLDFKGF
jgi:hypothetical protein